MFGIGITKPAEKSAGVEELRNIEDAIQNTSPTLGYAQGTFIYQTDDVTVIVNETGKAITVILQ